jgi:hypothetical protein
VLHEFKKPNLDLFVCFLVAIRCFSCNSINYRINEFEAILGQHVLTNHLDQISIDEIEQAVNRGSVAPYTTRQVETIFWRYKKSWLIFLKS